jgi:hypothetical protein
MLWEIYSWSLKASTPDLKDAKALPDQLGAQKYTVRGVPHISL